MDKLDPQFIRAYLPDLLESDAVYFESGADCVSFDGGRIVRMSGMESLAAGCVVQRIDVAAIGEDAGAWLSDVEHRVAELGCPKARLYLQEDAPALERALVAGGYRCVDEIALLMTPDSETAAFERSDRVTLSPIEDEAAWAVKLDIHRLIERGPDGHLSAAHKWVELERRKSDHGYMTPYLIHKDGKPAGAVNVAVWGNIVRLKNLVVHPDYRRRGVGRRAAARWAELVVEHGKQAAGCFALDSSHALIMYQQAGFRPASRQSEWVKELKQT